MAYIIIANKIIIKIGLKESSFRNYMTSLYREQNLFTAVLILDFKENAKRQIEWKNALG